MKKIIYLSFVLLLACARPGQDNTPTFSDTLVIEDSTAFDSVAVNEGVEAGLYSIDDKIKRMTLNAFGNDYPAQQLLTMAYWPDKLQETPPENEEFQPWYSITNVEIIGANFFKSTSNCEHRDVLLVTRMEIHAEYYDVIFLEQTADGTPKVADRVTFDGSQAQTETQVAVTTEQLGSDKNCFLLKVTSSSEGGDINLHRDSWVEFFVADDRGFHSVLRLVLEETDVQDFEASQNENLDSSSEIREFEFDASSNYGLFDIKVHTVRKQNGEIISEADEVFSFNGQRYVNSL